MVKKKKKQAGVCLVGARFGPLGGGTLGDFHGTGQLRWGAGYGAPPLVQGPSPDPATIVGRSACSCPLGPHIQVTYHSPPPLQTRTSPPVTLHRSIAPPYSPAATCLSDTLCHCRQFCHPSASPRSSCWWPHLWRHPRCQPPRRNHQPHLFLQDRPTARPPSP